MRTHFLLLPLALGLSLWAGCSEDSTPPSENPNQTPDDKVARSSLPRDPSPEVSDQAKAQLVQGHNTFAFELFDLLRKDQGPNNNVFFSPTSMVLALSMTYAGARNNTAVEMAEAMHFTLPEDQLFAGFNWLDQVLEQRADTAYEVALADWKQDTSQPAPPESDYRLHIVNSVWGEKTMTFETPFLDILATNYDAGVYLADFINQPAQERERINTWVADETLGRIQDFIPPQAITSATRSVLVNAIHLKLPWNKKFYENGDMSFTRPDGSSVQVPSIAKQESLAYVEEDGLQAIRIALKGMEVELMLVAPSVGQLEAFEAALTEETFQALYDRMEYETVKLKMPTVSFTTPSIPMSLLLQQLGMKEPFAPGADFSGITTEIPLFISEVYHKAMLGIDLYGLEAAAATAVIMNEGSAPMDPVSFDIDRPYFVAVVDATKTVLFAGHIVDPTAE